MAKTHIYVEQKTLSQNPKITQNAHIRLAFAHYGD